MGLPYFYLNDDMACRRFMRQQFSLYGQDYYPYFPLPSNNDRFPEIGYNMAEKPLSDGAPVVKMNKENFTIVFKVKHFAQEELKVKLNGGSLIVFGKQEERAESYGFVTREFKRRVVLPGNCDTEKIECCYSAEDESLTVTTPWKIVDEPDRIIPVVVERRVKPTEVQKVLLKKASKSVKQ